MHSACPRYAAACRAVRFSLSCRLVWGNKVCENNVERERKEGQRELGQGREGRVMRRGERRGGGGGDLPQCSRLLFSEL